MKITKVCCQGCGADLQIDESIRFVTCNYCHAQLEVVHDTSVTHTRQLDKIERTTDGLAKKVNIIELQNDVEHLDREWESFRTKVLVRGPDGQLVEPSTAEFFGMGIMAVIAGLGIIGFAIAGGGPLLAIVGILLICAGAFRLFSRNEKAEIYQGQMDRYQSARQNLIGRIDQERKR